MRPVEHLPLMLVGNQMVFDAHVVVTRMNEHEHEHEHVVGPGAEWNVSFLKRNGAHQGEVTSERPTESHGQYFQNAPDWGMKMIGSMNTT